MGAHVGGRSGAGTSPAATWPPSGGAVFTTYLFPFEITSALLVIAVVGAVVLARPSRGSRPAATPTASAMRERSTGPEARRTVDR